MFASVDAHSQGFTVTDVLIRGVELWPDECAVIDEHGSLTFKELLASAHRDAQLLAAHGLKPGDRVLLMLPTSTRFVSVWLGCMLRGLVEVPVNTDYTGEMLQHIIRDSRASAMITTREFADRVENLDKLRDLEILCIIDGIASRSSAKERTFETVLESSDFMAPAPTTPDMPIGVLYTSGTTGPSKGAVITHKQAFAYAKSVAEIAELRPGDVYYGPLPMFHIAGQWAVVYAALLTGATAHIRERFSLSSFWDDCAQSNANITYLLGAMAQLVMRQSGSEGRQSTLRRMLMVPLVQDVEEFRRRFNMSVTTCYGSTEAGVPLAADYSVADSSTIGTIQPGYQLRIVDEQNRDVHVGQTGELLIRMDDPDLIFQGYFGNEAATEKAMRDGWFHSGDLVWRDERDQYHFADRKKDALRRRGENISSFEVEREFYAHPLVRECAAIGIPSELTEDDLVVYVVGPGTPHFRDELTEFVRSRAPRFMWPDAVVLVEAIPKTPTGKTSKQELRQRHLRCVSRESEDFQ